VVDVPRSSAGIPYDVRAQRLLDDAVLAEELRLMTDVRTEELAILTPSQVTPRPWLFGNRPSRQVVDLQRPAHELEVTYDVGMGAVYTPRLWRAGVR
jgi:hypothetical protein